MRRWRAERSISCIFVLSQDTKITTELCIRQTCLMDDLPDQYGLFLFLIFQRGSIFIPIMLQISHHIWPQRCCKINKKTKIWKRKCWHFLENSKTTYFGKRRWGLKALWKISKKSSKLEGEACPYLWRAPSHVLGHNVLLLDEILELV